MLTTTSLTLLEGLRGGGSPRAWREMFRRYSPMLLAYVQKLGLRDADAQDAVQETLIAVHQAFAQMNEPFDRTKGRFKAWLRGVAQHKARDIQRRSLRHDNRTPFCGGPEASNCGRMVHTADATAAGTVNEMGEIFEREWQRNQLDYALRIVAAESDPAVYQAFDLYAVRGQSPDKVAALLGISRNAVYISKTRVIQKIRTILAQLKEEEG